MENDPRWFKKKVGFHQPLTMNMISNLPICALEKVMPYLTRQGKSELEYRRYLIVHPGRLK